MKSMGFLRKLLNPKSLIPYRMVPLVTAPDPDPLENPTHGTSPRFPKVIMGSSFGGGRFLKGVWGFQAGNPSILGKPDLDSNLDNPKFKGTTRHPT